VARCSAQNASYGPISVAGLMGSYWLFFDRATCIYIDLLSVYPYSIAFVSAFSMVKI